MGLDNEVGGC